MHKKTLTTAWIALCALLLSGGPAPGGIRPGTTPPEGLRAKPADHRAFTHARIVVSPDLTIEEGTLVVRDGRVVAVGSGLPVPEGAVEHDLDGKTIHPGFIDPITEYGLSHVGPLNPPRTDKSPKYLGTRVGANAWNDSIHAERDWIDGFRPDQKLAETYLKRGVTVVQSARLDGIFRGRAFVTTLAEGLPNELVIRPDSLHFASFDKGSSQQAYPSSLMGSIALIRQTLLDASWYAEAEASRSPEQERPQFDQAIRSLSADADPIVFEAGDELSQLRAARISQEFSRPMILVGNNLEYNRIGPIAEMDLPVIVPLVFPPRPPVGTFEGALDVSLADLRHWERAPGNAAALEAAGVTFAFTGQGLDDRKKQDFLTNLRKTVAHGLSPRAALAALTTVPAELCGVSEDVGTLEEGKLANFFIADADVLAEEARIWSVWVAGKPVQEFVSLDQTDFRGTYRVAIGRTGAELILEGKIDELTGRLTVGEDTSDLAGVEVQRDRVRFHAAAGALGAVGIVRFVLAGEPGSMTGQAWFSDDGAKVLTVERTGPPPAEEEGDTGENLETLSRLSFPNVGFGYEQPPPREDVLLRGATIWTGKQVLRQADLLVEDGKISAVGRDLRPGKNVRVVDASGSHVTPGLIDEHSHLAISRGVNEGSHAVTAEVRIGDVINADDIGIYRALAGGVTSAQLLHGSANPIGGQAQVIKMRWGAPPEALKFEGAPPSIKFALGENVKQSNWGDHMNVRYPQSRMGVETIMEDAFTAAREYDRQWREYESLPTRKKARGIPPRRDLQLEALLEILNSERFVHCHSYMQAEILMLMRLAERFGFRIQTFTHILEGYKVAPEMASHGATASSFSDWWAYKFEVYEAIPYNTCLLHDAGVVTSVNSDSAEVIRRLNQEAGKSVMYCGMNQVEALKMVTLNPAIQLGIDDRVGSLEPGKDADFAVWNAAPLSMYARVVETWVDGRRYFDLERDARLRHAVREERQALIQKVLMEEHAAGEDEGGEDEAGARPGHKTPRVWDCEDVDDVWID